MKSLKPFYPDFLLARVISQANHQRKQSKAVTIIQKRSFWAIKKHLKNHPHKNIYISGDRYRLLKQIEMAIVLYFCNLDPLPPSGKSWTVWRKILDPSLLIGSFKTRPTLWLIGLKHDVHSGIFTDGNQTMVIFHRYMYLNVPV